MPTSPEAKLAIAKSMAGPESVIAKDPETGEDAIVDCIILNLKNHPDHYQQIALPRWMIRKEIEPQWNRMGDQLLFLDENQPKLLIPKTILQRVFLELGLRAIPPLPIPPNPPNP